jgi:hypothetical protein
MEQGGASFSIPGETDRGCAPADATPWVRHGPAYVVRLDQLGRARVVSSCEGGACTVKPGTELSLADLVMVDGRDEEVTPRLLEALAGTAGPPRILVNHVPVESAGVHGLGGSVADAAFRYLQPALQQALRAGLFVGVLSAHDRNLQVLPDLGPALMRSDKVALPHPVFQVVSGAASDPDALHAGRRVDRLRGFTASPALQSDHEGFAVIRLTPETVDVELHARPGRNWETGSIELPLVAPAYPPARHVTSQTPCRDCPAIPDNVRP